jgi:putative component of membrane protein insertase Oxa1/YidC/SpoIIIJ protein YidD
MINHFNFFASLQKIFKFFHACICFLLIAMLTVLRPLLGPSACKFTIGCTQYAVMQLQEKNIFVALWLIAKRLLACNPFNKSVDIE